MSLQNPWADPAVLFGTNITASQLCIFQKPIQNWKAMAKDRTNYYQLTPAQIRTKMKHFRRDTVSWNCYMKDRKERGLEEIELEIWFCIYISATPIHLFWGFSKNFTIFINLETGYKNAKTNPRDQGIPFHCSPKGCLLCQNQEEQGEHQIQGLFSTERMILIIYF